MMFGERAAYYREAHSNIYNTGIYVLACTLVEVPYLLLSSLLYIVPFFFIVGFDNTGDVAVKFFWYWLFQALYLSALVFLGHFLAAAAPSEQLMGVIGGLTSTMITLFAGFMIRAQDMPTFWTFMYWLDPLHYAVEGVVVTQFQGDDTPITTAYTDPTSR